MATVSPVMSDMFYQAALAFDRPFTLEDITPLSNAERRAVAATWLAERVVRGELRRIDRNWSTRYEWVNG